MEANCFFCKLLGILRSLGQRSGRLDGPEAAAERLRSTREVWKREVGQLYANALSTAALSKGVDQDLLWQALHFSGPDLSTNILHQCRLLLIRLNQLGASKQDRRSVCEEMTKRGFTCTATWDKDGDCLFESRIDGCVDNPETAWDDCVQEETEDAVDEDGGGSGGGSGGGDSAES